MRPWTWSDAASPASRRTERRACASSVRERDALDTLVEHDLAVERAMHGALRGDDPQALDLLVRERVRAPDRGPGAHGAVRGDDPQALDLLVRERVREPDDEPEAGGATALGRRVLARDLDA